MLVSLTLGLNYTWSLASWSSSDNEPQPGWSADCTSADLCPESAHRGAP